MLIAPEEGFPWDKVDAAKRYLTAIKPWWGRFMKSFVIVPVEVMPDFEGVLPYGSTTATDRDFRIYVDRLFALSVPVHYLAGALEHELQRHTRDSWKRFGFLKEEAWREQAVPALDLEINSTIDREQKKLTMDEVWNICNDSVVFTTRDLEYWNVTNPPGFDDDGWIPRVLGMDDGLSAEQYHQIIKKLMEAPPPQEDDDEGGGSDEENEDAEEKTDETDEQSGEEDSEDAQSDSQESKDEPEEPEESDNEDQEEQAGSEEEEQDGDDQDGETSGSADEGDESSDSDDSQKGESGGLDNDGEGDGSDSENIEDGEETDGDSGEPTENGGESGNSESEQEGDNSESNSSESGESQSESSTESGAGGETNGEPQEATDWDKAQVIRELQNSELGRMWQNSIENPTDPIDHPAWKPSDDLPEYDLPDKPTQSEMSAAFEELSDDIGEFSEELNALSSLPTGFGNEIGNNLMAWRESYRKSRGLNWDRRFLKLANALLSSTQIKGQSDLSYSVRNPNQAQIGPILQGLLSYSPTIYVLQDVSGSMHSGKMATSMTVFSDLCKKVLANYGDRVTWFSADTALRDVGKTSRWNEDIRQAWSFGFGGTQDFGQIIDLMLRGKLEFRGKKYKKPDLLITSTDCLFPWVETRPRTSAKLLVVNVGDLQSAEMYLPEWLDMRREFVQVDS